jgi:hypothetical protein
LALARGLTVIPALLGTPTKPLNQQDEKASRWVNSHAACITQTFGAACEIMPNICYKPPMVTASSRRLPDVIFLNPMTDAETTALVERARLSMTLVLIAASREVEAARGSDHRYAETADAIKRIAATMDQVSDDVLLKLVTVNQLSEGPLSTLIATRLSEVGGALPVYEDAKAFFQSLVKQVDQILRRARRHMH